MRRPGRARGGASTSARSRVSPRSVSPASKHRSLACKMRDVGEQTITTKRTKLVDQAEGYHKLEKVEG